MDQTACSAYSPLSVRLEVTREASAGEVTFDPRCEQSQPLGDLEQARNAGHVQQLVLEASKQAEEHRGRLIKQTRETKLGPIAAAGARGQGHSPWARSPSAGRRRRRSRPHARRRR